MRVNMMVQVLRLAWLICGFFSVVEAALGADTTPLYRIYNGVSQAACPESQLGQDSATVTEVPGETESKACGVREYDSLNEICCESTVLPKSGPKAECCGKEVYDEEKQLCCGPIDDKKILNKTSKDHRCCGHDQFNNKTQCCCPTTLKIQSRPVDSDCCREDTGLTTGRPTEEAKCGGEVYDEEKQLCCGPIDDKKILNKTSKDHRCCGHDQFNIKIQCCCPTTLIIQSRAVDSDCCREDTGLTTGRPAEEAKCGGEVYDEEKQLCCGPIDDKKILNKTSKDHRCCGHDQFNNKTQCCCPTTLKIQSRAVDSDCCREDTGLTTDVQPQMNDVSLPKCRKANSSICGSEYFNPKEHRCCERKHTKPSWCCPSGECDAVPTVYNPNTHICCDGCLSVLTPWKDQCCGGTPYGMAQRGVLCCNDRLYENREDEEECTESGYPYNPTKGTMCASRFYTVPGIHCCGSETFQPTKEICCNGHRHTKRGNTICCGNDAYNGSDPSKKCCAGTLYNMTRGKNKGKCCGSLLKNSEKVCCTSEKTEKLYSAKTGFLCCGHQYYNTSLWSCCAGKLGPVQPSQNGSITGCTLQSVINLGKRILCNQIFMGLVESVSLNSTVFSKVLEIDGKTGIVKLWASPRILETPDHCKSPKLTPGKAYYFRDNNVFTDFNHNSVLQSLHFILSKCSQ